MRSRFGQNQRVFKAGKCLFQMIVVLFAACDEVRQLCELRSTKGGLHIGSLQIVANMRIRVLVVIPTGERSQLPLKALAASVVFPGLAPAIAPPVAKRFDKRL